MIRIYISIVFAIVIFSAFNCQKEKPYLIVKEFSKLPSGNIGLVIENPNKYKVKIFTIKQNEGNYNKLLYFHLKHLKSLNAWGQSMPWYGSNSYDSVYIEPKKKSYFYLDIKAEDYDSLLIASKIEIMNNHGSIFRTFNLCLIIKNFLISEFEPNFEIKQKLFSIDPNKLIK